MDQYNIELALESAACIVELSIMNIQIAAAQSHYLVTWVMDEWSL